MVRSYYVWGPELQSRASPLYMYKSAGLYSRRLHARADSQRYHSRTAPKRRSVSNGELALT